MGGDNREKFDEINVKIARVGLNGISFSSGEGEIDLEKFNPLMEDIITRYRKNVRRSVYIKSEEVAYFRGAESSHLKKIKDSTLIEHVFFNNRESEDGIMMVEVAVVGNNLCVDRFMWELLKSISSFKQKQLKYTPPPRPERRQKES